MNVNVVRKRNLSRYVFIVRIGWANNKKKKETCRLKHNHYDNWTMNLLMPIYLPLSISFVSPLFPPSLKVNFPSQIRWEFLVCRLLCNAMLYLPSTRYGKRKTRVKRIIKEKETYQKMVKLCRSVEENPRLHIEARKPSSVDIRSKAQNQSEIKRRRRSKKV